MTFIEVLAALTVFSVIAAGLAANTIATTRWSTVTRNTSVATTLAQDLIEQLRALDPTSNPAALTPGAHADAANPITPTGAPRGQFTRQWTVAANSPSAGLGLLTVTVSWPQNGRSRSVTLITYFCRTATCA